MEHSLDRTRRSMKHRGIAIVPCKLQNNVCLSLENGRIVGVDESRLLTEAEKNTVLIHEDGHFISKAFYKPFSVYQIKAQAEYRANKAAMLKYIPYQELLGMMRRGVPLWDIAEHFCVTPECIQKAYDFYKDLGYTF